MANFKLSIVLLAVVTVVASQPLIAPRMIGGTAIDTMRRFSHHVTIEKDGFYDGRRSICGGSILNERWILTSALCVDNSDRLQVHFERLYLNQTTGSYTAVVNSDAVHIYPTYYDDIALLKLPFNLVFSDLIKPVNISSQSVSQTENKLAVLPGFDASAVYSNTVTEQLTYAMMTVIPNSNCQPNYSDFDEYLQLCAKSYSNNANTPCLTDYGGGLLIGWPAKSELIGIYSGTSHDCSPGTPSVYTNVAKYSSWINSLINS